MYLSDIPVLSSDCGHWVKVIMFRLHVAMLNLTLLWLLHLIWVQWGGREGGRERGGGEAAPERLTRKRRSHWTRGTACGPALSCHRPAGPWGSAWGRACPDWAACWATGERCRIKAWLTGHWPYSQEPAGLHKVTYTDQVWAHMWAPHPIPFNQCNIYSHSDCMRTFCLDCYGLKIRSVLVKYLFGTAYAKCLSTVSIQHCVC